MYKEGHLHVRIAHRYPWVNEVETASISTRLLSAPFAPGTAFIGVRREQARGGTGHALTSCREGSCVYAHGGSPPSCDKQQLQQQLQQQQQQEQYVTFIFEVLAL